MLEIHIDIGRLAPFGVEEALKQHVDLGGIDRGDGQGITDHRIGGRAAALAKNALAAGELHNVVNGQEIMRDMALGDEAQLLFRQLRHMHRRAARIAPSQSGFGQIAQMLVGSFAARHRLARIALAQLRQGESDLIGKAQVSATASGQVRNRRAISGGGFKWRSALA